MKPTVTDGWDSGQRRVDADVAGVARRLHFAEPCLLCCCTADDIRAGLLAALTEIETGVITTLPTFLAALGDFVRQEAIERLLLAGPPSAHERNGGSDGR